MALISYLTKIQFDHGAIRLLADELKILGIARPLIVTDKGVVAAGIWDRVRSALPGSTTATLFDRTPANPTERAAYGALEVYRSADCDGIVGLGGGSSMDLAKAVAVLVGHPPPLFQYAMVEGGVARITAKAAPVVAIPTTAGTGSEVGRGAIIVFDNGRKTAVVSPHIIPKVAICDPELTLGLPPLLTAATGMDAVAHNLETFLSPAINPPAEAIGLDGLARALRWIERAVYDGANREARWHMMMASMQGAMCFQKGLGAIHGLSHPLGTLGYHHGTLNAVVMPQVLRFNVGHVGDKYDRICRACDLPAGTDLAATITGLNRRLGLPSSLGAMGVTAAEAEKLVDAAFADHCTPTNPRRLSRDDYARLFAEAIDCR